MFFSVWMNLVVGRWECGNRRAISKDRGKREGNLGLVFLRFPRVRHFHGPPRLAQAERLTRLANSFRLASRINIAASVSDILVAIWAR